MPIPRDAVQTVVTKLDLNAMTLKAAKEHIRTTYGETVPGRTKREFIRNLARQANN